MHDVLVWLVGSPPNAHGMSSWKKCGMSLVNVRRISSKKSARAGKASAHASANAAIGEVSRETPHALEVITIYRIPSKGLTVILRDA